jgi:hypothetical protein
LRNVSISDFGPLLDVDHLAGGVEPEAHRGLLMAGVIESACCQITCAAD